MLNAIELGSAASPARLTMTLLSTILPWAFVAVPTTNSTRMLQASSRIVESNVIVKRAGDAAEPNSMAFSIAHPSFFRRFGFRFMELGGHSPNGCYPCPMSDHGQRQGVIEIDEILSGVRLDAASIRKNVLTIAGKCGLEFTQEQLDGLIAAAGG